jgi:hypothetical protein
MKTRENEMQKKKSCPTQGYSIISFDTFHSSKYSVLYFLWLTNLKTPYMVTKML